MEISGQLHDPAALPSGKEPLVPIGWEAKRVKNNYLRSGYNDIFVS